MKIPLILIAIASTALAQNKGRLLEPEILQPWDRLARDNITITAQTAAGAFQTDKKYFSKTFDVVLSPVGSNRNPATVELYFLMKRDGFVSHLRRVGAQQADVGVGRLTFVCDQAELGIRADDIKDWLVRAVRDGRVAGFAASSGPCEDLAKNPALLSDMLAQEWQRK